MAQHNSKHNGRRGPGTGRYAHVVGWGVDVPEKVMTNAEIELLVDTSDEWIRDRTGIAQRHIADERETGVSMGVRASRRALTMANMQPRDLDMIIVATSSPDYMFPATANLIQDKLGAPDAGAFDLLAACTGFIYGLGLASAQIKSGAIDNALIVGTETLSRIVDWTDRGTCILFGDGAGAFVLKASDIPGGVGEYVLHSDGSGGDYLYARTSSRKTWNGSTLIYDEQNIKMNGREVYRFASRVMAQATEEVLEKAGKTIDDVSLIVPHQANLRIIQAAARGLNLPMEKLFVNLEKFGNTSTASIPLAVADAIEAGRIQPNDRLVLVGFGAGLTWGAIMIDWQVEPTPRSQLSEVLRESWYILARVRSLLLRLRRFVEALVYYPRQRRKSREKQE